MPGLTFAIGRTLPESMTQDTSISAVPVNRSTFVADSQLALFIDSVPGQPLSTHTDGSVTAILDGVWYGLSKNAVETNLRELTDSFRQGGPSAAVATLKRLAETFDGEFVVALVDTETKRALVATDALGRLPLYWHQIGGTGLIVSRVAQHARAGAGLDRIGGAEQAWLRFPLEDRTLIEGVKRTPPAAALSISWDGGAKATLTTYHQWDLSTPTSSKESVDQLAGHLAERFKHACVTRSVPKGTTALLSLSGGLDSRAVAAGLAIQEVPMQARTYARAGTEHDVSGARDIASLLGFSWSDFQLNPSLATTYRSRVVRLTEGLNHAQMGFILEFFDHLTTTTQQPAWYFTGDGGDRVLPDLLPPERPKTFDELIRVMEARFTIAPAAVVETAYGIPKGTLRDNLRSHVAGYPEKSHSDRIVHFMVMQMAYKWLFEGENRNRHFFWSVSPFFNRDFFTASLSAPLATKRGYALYNAMLKHINAEIAAIPFAGRGNLPMNSLRWKTLEFSRGLVPLPVRNAIRRRRYRGQSLVPLAELSRLQLDSSAATQLLETDAAKYLVTQSLLGASVDSGPPTT
jgi:asparagine synthase (glutamine-hydrolysing)